MLDAIRGIFVQETDAERQVRELQLMDDHQLADLGISRDQICAFVKEHAPAAEHASLGCA